MSKETIEEPVVTDNKINLNVFNFHHQKGYVRKQTYNDLTIWNYTQRAAFDRFWNDCTLLARGLITLRDGTIHARSFRKFFNLGEKPGPDLSELPTGEAPIVTRKEDGFLGLSYFDPSTKSVRIASRGSFGSEFARWATDWLHSHNKTAALDVQEQVKYTYVFEILYPRKRIVVDNSGRYGLVLLAAFDNETGEEMSRADLEVRARLYRWEIVKNFNTVASIGGKPVGAADLFTSVANKYKGDVNEGFVLHWPQAKLRVKIKGEDYCRIHRAVSRLSARHIWEIASLGSQNNPTMIQVLKTLPPEYRRWAISCWDELKKDYISLLGEVHAAEMGVRALWDWKTQRKQAVQFLRDNHSRVWHLACASLDGKTAELEEIIWKRLKPEHVVPVFNEEEQ